MSASKYCSTVEGTKECWQGSDQSMQSRCYRYAIEACGWRKNAIVAKVHQLRAERCVARRHRTESFRGSSTL
eukprot:3711-Heterococcus_DN1.PRE.6